MAFKDRVIAYSSGSDNDNTNYMVVFWSSELDSTVGECVSVAPSASVDGWGRIDVDFRNSVVAFREGGGVVGVWFG